MDVKLYSVRKVIITTKCWIHGSSSRALSRYRSSLFSLLFFCLNACEIQQVPIAVTVLLKGSYLSCRVVILHRHIGYLHSCKEGWLSCRPVTVVSLHTVIIVDVRLSFFSIVNQRVTIVSISRSEEGSI